MVALLLLGCVGDTPQDPSDWFGQGTDLDVEEAIAFTTEPYDFPAAGSPGIEDLAGAFSDAQGDPEDFRDDAIAFADGDGFVADCDALETSELPLTIEGIVTLHPRFYFKTGGCTYKSDEKYYGSYFIADSTGGVFVLGDSRVAHFDVGDRVIMKVRGVKHAFDLDMIYAHDIVDVARVSEPIYYEVADGRELGDADVGQVRRVTGTVISDKDTFGEFTLEDDTGVVHTVSMDAEINRRKVGFEQGDRVSVTGPVLFSYDAYSIVIMNVGQLEALD